MNLLSATLLGLFLSLPKPDASPEYQSRRSPLRPLKAKAEEPQAQWPSLSGLWAFIQVTGAISDAPVIGKVSTKTQALGIIDVSQDKAQLRLSETMCELSTSSPTPLVRTVYPQAFLNALSGNIRRAQLIREENRTRFIQAQAWDAHGTRLTNISTDPLPTLEKDPRVIDEDEDGFPGLTVHITGLVGGKVRVVTKGWTALEGELISNNRIEGYVRWFTEQRILSATNSLLKSPPRTSPDKDPTQSWFRMIRPSSDTTCRDLRAKDNRWRNALLSSPIQITARTGP